MINIHLYPSAFLNESRIMRESRSLSRLALFNRIDLVGLGQEGTLPVESLDDGVRIVRIGQHGGAGLLRKLTRTSSWSSAVYRRYCRQRVTCINCHSVATLPLGVMLSRATGAKLVYDAHELESETNGLNGVRKRLTKRVERMLIGRADQCIFVADAIEQWYIDEYQLKNTTVLYNCPPHFTVEPTDYFRQKFNIDSRTPIFLYQGLIGEGRGIRVLVEAFSSLASHAALVVMGYGPLANWIAEEAKARPGLYYHPAVTPDKLRDLTAAADFGLSVIEPTSLSYEYCMPNKLFEYVMANKPVLVSPTREQSNFVRKHAVGEVARDTSPIALREAVMSLLARDLQALQSALRLTAREYCWENQEKKLETIYREALGLSALHAVQISQCEV
jgi:glycosyltransferase involved in cell wall biosynthesis